MSTAARAMPSSPPRSSKKFSWFSLPLKLAAHLPLKNSLLKVKFCKNYLNNGQAEMGGWQPDAAKFVDYEATVAAANIYPKKGQTTK